MTTKALMPTKESETNLRRFAAGSLSGLCLLNMDQKCPKILTSLRRAFYSTGTLSICFAYPLELIRVRLAYVTRSPETKGNSIAPISGSNTRLPEYTAKLDSNIHFSESKFSRRTLRDAISDIYHESSHFKPTTPFLTELRSCFSASTNAGPLASPSRILRAHLFYHFPIFSFYRGFTVSIMGMIPYAGTSFLTWGYLRSILITDSNQRGSKPTPVMDLAIGAIAGSVSQTVSYPFEIIRRRMQVGGITNGDPRAWLTFGETVRKIYATRGLAGFYVGLSIGYAKVIPMTATSFAVWQWGKRLLGV